MSLRGDDDNETERDPDSSSDTGHAETQPASLITRLADSQSVQQPRIRRPSQLELEVGQKLGDRYVVRGFLGMGGMGAVYHVFDETLGEDVALKAVRSAIATTSGLRDEVKIAQKVTHANVCRTYDLEDIDGRHFVKMEYVPGETLAARIERGKLSIDDTIRIARGVAAGLAAAHARGIVHRDLKPGNVMLDGERVVLMDFGLAQYANAGEADRSGTPGYMSPEQLAGVVLDHRSDLFALGCLVHEMLTAERLFGTGSLTEIESRQSVFEIPDTRAKRPDTPKWLARATTLLLSRDRERRPAGLGLLERGPTSKLPAALLAVGVGAIVVGGVWLATRSSDATWKPALKVIRRPMHGTELISRASIAPDSASFVLVVEDGTGSPGVVVQSPLPNFEPTKLFETPAKTDLIRHLRDGSGFVMCAGHRRQENILIADPKGVAVPHARGFDPEDCGDALIAIDVVESGDVYYQWQLVEIGKASGSKPRVLFRGEVGQPIDHPRCDRAGRRIVFSMRESKDVLPIYLLDRTPGAKPVRIAIGETPTFIGDNAVIYSYEGRLIEHSLASHDEHLITTDEGPYYAPEVSPDGRTLLFNREEYAAAVYLGGPSYPGVGYLVPMELQDLRSAYVTPDRSTVIVQRFGGPPEITAIDARTGKKRLLASGDALFLSRDGTELYFRPERRPAELHAVPVGGGESRLVVEIPKYRVRDGVDGPDGLHLGLMIVDDALQPTGEMRAVRVPHGTRDVINEGNGIVLPAPTGAWRARGIGFDIELSDGTGKLRRTRCFGPATWLDDHRFACSVAPQRIEILDVTDDSRSAITLPWPERVAFLMADGEHWVGVRDTNSITTLAITNFSDRPWAP